MNKYILYCFLVIVLFPISCTVPIDFDFGESEFKTIVIDGYLTDSLRKHEIRLGYTSHFNRNGVFVPAWITDASVRIIDDIGQEIILRHTGSGVYAGGTFVSLRKW